MDGQNQQPKPQEMAPKAPGATDTHPVDPSKLNLSDREAQALLLINNVEGSRKPKNGPSLGLLVSLAVLVVLVVLASFALNSLKSDKNLKSSSDSDTTSSNRAGNNPTSDTNSQVRQDINTCSNPLEAAAQC